MTEQTPSRNRLAALAILLIALAAAACTDNQQTSGRKVATLGETLPLAAPADGLIGGHQSRTETITGAGVVAIPGAEVGAYVDRFERDMRTKTAGTGIDLQRHGNELLLTIPSRIAFDGNGSTIGPSIRTTLDQVARLLAQYHQSYVDVSGYAEQTMDESAAAALSRSQAQSVADYLQARSVLAARIGAQGFGRSSAAAGRRVEIKLVPLTEADLPPPPPAAASVAQ
jgi:outer membrane protein OmpA-like peptidoglycan-associated protein